MRHLWLLFATSLGVSSIAAGQVTSTPKDFAASGLPIPDVPLPDTQGLDPDIVCFMAVNSKLAKGGTAADLNALQGAKGFYISRINDRLFADQSKFVAEFTKTKTVRWTAEQIAPFEAPCAERYGVAVLKISKALREMRDR